MLNLDKEQILDIISITYLRIMQLRFSWQFIGTMVGVSYIEDNYPNLTWSLKSSFATDAYTTINAMLSSGNYSFGRLGQEYPDIQTQVKKAEEDISSVIGDFRNIRNQVFCHAVKKKSQDNIDKIYWCFSFVFDILTNLHFSCCNLLKIKDDDFKHYDSKALEDLEKETQNFRSLLLNGHLDDIEDRF